MCRLFAVRAASPVRVDRAFDSLKRAAREHKDGWGIARFDADPPLIETNLAPAHACARFAELGSSLLTRSLLTHIRLASVGRVCTENAHPFFARGWAFMHNGTLRRFEKRRAQFEAELAPKWRQTLRGETDSERCFALFMTYLDALAEPSLADIARCLARVMRVGAAICDRTGEPKPSAMNFIVTDGSRTVATRRGRTLFELSRTDACFIASDELWGDAAWHEVPEDGVVGVEADLSLHRWTVAQLLSPSGQGRGEGLDLWLSGRSKQRDHGEAG